MVVTIDGPAGSGKSTAARKLAARLQIAYLDTGAMYRAIALAALVRGVDLSDENAVTGLARGLRLELDCGPTFTRVKVDGVDVSEAIRTMAVSRATSEVAQHQAVRALLVAEQRKIGRRLGSFVSEGRDQGSVVFPEADAKFVLEAGAVKRAERRYQEHVADGEEISLEAVLENVLARDAIDSKQWEPLLIRGEAIVLDTTHLSIAEVIDRMVAELDRIRS